MSSREVQGLRTIAILSACGWETSALAVLNISRIWRTWVALDKGNNGICPSDSLVTHGDCSWRTRLGTRAWPATPLCLALRLFENLGPVLFTATRFLHFNSANRYFFGRPRISGKHANSRARGKKANLQQASVFKKAAQDIQQNGTNFYNFLLRNTKKKSRSQIIF